jgi:NAD(P)-dependent dehydrogenase (short-subunit alcohol dehydrogenase family)
VGKVPFSEFDLSGKVAIVTGGGRGIGYHISLGLAKYGADVVVCGRTLGELERAGAEIEKMGRRVLIQQTDVGSLSQIRALAEESVKGFGRIDILVNNAGINIPQRAVNVTEEAWDKIIDTNLKGVFFCAQAVGRVMIEQRKGKIINISSQSGQVGLPQRAAYCASKGGVNLLTKVLAIEWAPYNINVNAVAPTFVETAFTKSSFAEEGFREYVLGNIPLGRMGQPEDVVGAVIYLASEASNLVTGHVLLVDGGWTAH